MNTRDGFRGEGEFTHGNRHFSLQFKTDKYYAKPCPQRILRDA